MTARSSRGCWAAHNGVARLRGEVSPETRARPRRGSRALGKGLGEFGVTRRTQSWARRRHRGNRGRGPRRSNPTATQLSSGERLRGQQGSTREIKGAGELFTSRGKSGALEQRGGRREALGRMRWSSDCTMKRPVSADRVKHRGWGQTRRCLTLLARRRSSPRQQTWQKLDGGQGTHNGPRRSSTGARTVRESERRCSAEGSSAQLSEGSE